MNFNDSGGDFRWRGRMMQSFFHFFSFPVLYFTEINVYLSKR